jgi:N-acetylmuramoyl-L-alanine amidase
MRIDNHTLVDAPEGIDLQHLPGKIAQGTFHPEIAVVHYAVTDSLDATYRAMKYRNFFAHVTVDGWQEESGTWVTQIAQHLPFNRRGAHAGLSDYKGRAKVNGFGLGIEIANPGPLVEKDGSLFTVYGKEWHGPVFEGRHRNPNVKYEYWAGFQDSEIDAVIHLCYLWRREYGIYDAVGHDEIAPNRKIDPGPAFPIELVRSTVFGCKP